MEKNRDLFKKTRDSKGTFHAKMGSMKDRNHMDLVHPKDQSWVFIGGTDAEAETPILWPPDVKS